MFSNPIHWALDENSNLPVSHAWRNPGWQIVLLEKHHVTCWLFMSPISHVRQKPVSYRLTHSKCCFPLWTRKWNSFYFLLSSWNDWRRQCCVSSAPALQGWVPADPQVKLKQQCGPCYSYHLSLPARVHFAPTCWCPLKPSETVSSV